MAIQSFELNFYGAPAQLYSTKLVDCAGRGYLSFRGKGNGALQGAGSFHWSAAVKAIAVLLVKAAKAISQGESLCSVLLIGGQGSPAKSLDYALCKKPGWIFDMFGVDSSGNSNLRRLIKLTNSGQKMPGPIIIGLNPHCIDRAALKITCEEQLLSSQVDFNLLLSDLEKGV